ncbi:MAG: hypothetical protein WCD11_21330 [Solirubrobacteraceae bacterium]
MTQQYLVGQFSALLGDLERTTAEWQPAVHSLRLEVESSPLAMLPELADKATELIDTICWAALQRGDITRWWSFAKAAAALGEFIDSAGLLRY